MAKYRRPLPPLGNLTNVPGKPIGVIELDRFTERSLDQWKSYSKDLDELHDVLYFTLEPERRRLRSELMGALQQSVPVVLALPRWVRLVTYQFSTMPLSCAGSLTSVGGRFNPGCDLDEGTLNPWPALYMAEDYETGFREKFQLAQSDRVNGLTPAELALGPTISYSTVFVQGKLHQVFDMTSPQTLEAVAKVLRCVKLPDRAQQLRKKLGIPNRQPAMIRSGQALYQAVFQHNWRLLPIQFGLPSTSHMLAELVRAAGFEAILYCSSKGSGRCLAVFPDKLHSASFVELADAAPDEVQLRRLDANTADVLAAWDALRPQQRPK